MFVFGKLCLLPFDVFPFHFNIVAASYFHSFLLYYACFLWLMNVRADFISIILSANIYE